MTSFKEYYDRYTALLNREANPRATVSDECEMGILNLLYNKNYDEAKNCIANFPGKGMYRKYCLWIEYNRLVGDYLEMTNAQTTLYRSRIKAQDSVRSNNFMEMNARFVNQKLEYENQRLEMDRQNLLSQRQTTELTNTHLKLANTQLTLRNSSLELRKAKSNSDLLRLRTTTSNLRQTNCYMSLTPRRHRNGCTTRCSCRICHRSAPAYCRSDIYMEQTQAYASTGTCQRHT